MEGSVRLKDVSVNKDLVNQRLNIIAILHGFEVRNTRNGGKYIQLKLRDGKKTEEAKIWDGTSEKIAGLVEGSVYEFVMDVKPYDASPNGVSLICAGYMPAKINPEEMIDWAEKAEKSAQYVADCISSVNGTVYGTLVSSVMLPNWEKFCRYPAAISHHHVEAGGLVWHTANVAALSVSIAKQFEVLYGSGRINYKLLLAGAVCHDIGKVFEYTVDDALAANGQTDEAAFGEHLIIGQRLLHEQATRLDLDKTVEYKMLEHMMLSHHQRKEWGSVVEPVTLEAYILGVADGIDAELWKYDRAISENIEGGLQTMWFGKHHKKVYVERSGVEVVI